ncbi:MAG: hypothetical protein AB9891_06950 [Anaerolineaceae bacterium]
MKTSSKAIAVCILMFNLLLSSCGAGQLSNPEPIPTPLELKSILQDESFKLNDELYWHSDSTVDYINNMTIGSNAESLEIHFSVDPQGMPRGSNGTLLNDLLIKIYGPQVARWVFSNLHVAVNKLINQVPKYYGDDHGEVEVKGTPSNYNVSILMEDAGGFAIHVTLTITPFPNGIIDTK